MADELQEVKPAGTDKGTIPLYDTENRAVVHMPFDDAEGLIQSGKYALPKDYKLPVVSPDGTAGTVDATEASKALQSGFKLETLAQQHERTLQEQYGGYLGQKAAETAGAARGLTFGLSDQLLTKTGLVEPETLRNLEEANPVSSYGGEAAGIIAPAVLTGGAANAVGAGVKGAAEAGELASHFVASQAAKAGLKNAVAKSIVEKIAPRAVGSAVEGAFYGAGQILSEDALGKADLNAESLANHVGAGMLIGGAFGGAIGAASELAGPVGKVLSAAASPFQKKISQGLEQDVAAARLFGMSPIQFSKLQDRNPKVAAGMQDYLANKLGLNLGDTAESLMQKNEAMQEAAGQKIGSTLDAIDAALVERPDLKPSGASIFGNIAQEIRQKVLTPLEGAFGPDSEEILGKVNNYINKLDELASKNADFSAQQLQTLKKAEDKLIKYNKVPGQWSIGDELRFTTRNALRNEIDLVANNLEQQGLSGELAAGLKEANSNYAAASTFGPMLERRALKAGDKTLNFAGYMKDAALDVSRKLIVLGKIEAAKQATQKVFTSTIDSLGSLAPKAAEILPPTTSMLLSSELAKSFTGDKAKKPSSPEQAYGNIVSNVTKYQQNPQNFVDKVNNQTSIIANVAPKTAGELSRVAVGAMDFLSTKLPRSASQPSMLDAYNPPKLPSSMELAKFERYMTVINKPATVLEGLKNGTVTRTEMEAFKGVYPAMYNELREQIIQKLPEIAQTMPYNRKLQLGMLFDVPADQSMQAGSILGLQSNFGTTAQAQTEQTEGVVKPSQGGLGKLDLASRERTPAQEVAAGEAD